MRYERVDEGGIDKIGRLHCSWCHTAVPHGWKNKALLVNLNDVGPEGGQAAGTQVRNNTSAYYNQQPYYLNAVLKIRNFRPSGQWQPQAVPQPPPVVNPPQLGPSIGAATRQRSVF